MDTVYLVCGKSGDYIDDKCEWNVKAFKFSDEAECFCNLLQEKADNISAEINELRYINEHKRREIVKEKIGALDPQSVLWWGDSVKYLVQEIPFEA